MNIALFFTYDVSLRDWQELGLLDRELALYNSISKDKNIKFTFVTYGNDDEKNILQENNNFKIVPLGNYLNYKNKYFRFILSLLIPFKLKNELKDIDILKTNQLMGSWIPIVLKYITKKPLIIRTGYDALEFAIKDKKSKIKIILYYFLTLLALKCSNMFFVTSKKDIENIKNRFKFFKIKNIYHRPNWVNITDSKKKITERKKETLLAVGRLETQKNYINLLSNLSNSDLEIHIFGTGSLKEKVKNFANKNNLKVNLNENINHSKLMNLYEDYMFFVMYSNYEGHPKTLIEAMSKGCIPIILKNENNTEIIDHYENGILLNGEKDSIEKWVIHLIDNKKEMERLSSNAVKFVKKHYSLSNAVITENNDYQSLVNKNK
ncbi:glycosyltransferase [Acidimicrobiaceae bacterium]|nr:glycosyltransferase [Acidimicrobiaceae bacterium]